MADGVCDNCGATLVGEYCHHCGQKELDADWQTIGAIGRQFWTELVRLDFKSVRTLGALLDPGRLPAAFIAGRRGRYLSPLKTYLLCAALFFLAAPAIAGFSLERDLAHDAGGQLQRMVDARTARTHMPPALFAERYNDNAKTVYTLSPILSVLAIMLVLRGLYRRRFARLGPHIVFALYYVAFFYVAALATGGIARALDLGPYVLFGLMQGTLAIYAFTALMRVYAEPVAMTIAKTAALIVIAFLIDSPVNMLAKAATVALP